MSRRPPRPAAWRALLRLAARDARRDRARSALVVALVALPVAAMVGALVVLDTGQPTTQEQATASMGRADLSATPTGSLEAGDPAADLRDRLPAGSEVEYTANAGGELRTDGVARAVLITVADLDDPDALGAGRYELVRGDAPEGRDQVALTADLLAVTERELGDELALDPLGEVEVTGVVRAPERLDSSFALASTETAASGELELIGALATVPGGEAPVDLGDDVAMGMTPGDEDTTWRVTTRDEAAAERFGAVERAVIVLVGGLAAVEVALVAGAAFAVSVRRRQRELGLLAAAGGTARHLRRSVLLGGITLGVVGAVLGTLLGVLAALAASPWFDAWFGRVTGPLRASPGWVAGVAAIGVLAALAAAWWPARAVARLPVLTALSGRRPAGTPSRRGLVRGLVLVVLGTATCLGGVAGAEFFEQAVVLVFLLGSVLVVLGAGLTSPWLLEQLGRLAPRLPAGPRLAVRDAARFRTRNGPIVTAAMAGLAATVTIATILGSLDAAVAAAYQPSLPDDVIVVQSVDSREIVASRVAADLDADRVELRPTPGFVHGPEGDGENGTVGGMLVTPAEAAALAGPAARDALDAGSAVALVPDAPSTVTHTAVDPESGEPSGAETSFEVTDVDLDLGLGGGGLTFGDVLLPLAEVVDPDQAQDLSGPQWLVFDGQVDDELVAEAGAAAQELDPDATVRAERGPPSQSGLTLAVVGLGALSGLLIVAIAIALASAEARPDLRTLTAVGAGERVRRSLAAGRALVLAGLGGLLAIPVGLLPAVVLLRTNETPLVLPWTELAIVGLAVPTLAALGAVLAASKPPAPNARAA